MARQKSMNDNVFSIDLGKQFPKNPVAWSINLVTIFCSRMLILLEKRQIKASGRRAGSEIAANGATDASANGGTDVRQTKARMFRETAGDHPETIKKRRQLFRHAMSIISISSSRFVLFPYCYLLVHPPPCLPPPLLLLCSMERKKESG